jgi:hypothetical protein
MFGPIVVIGSFSAGLLPARGRFLFAKTCEVGLYEPVSKTLSSLYSSGKCWNWLKVRNLASGGASST